MDRPVQQQVKHSLTKVILRLSDKNPYPSQRANTRIVIDKRHLTYNLYF